MNPKKKNLLLLALALSLVAGAVLLGFRESIFGGGVDTTSAETRAVIDEMAKTADPMPAQPQQPVFSKTARKAGGN